MRVWKTSSSGASSTDGRPTRVSSRPWPRSFGRGLEGFSEERDQVLLLFSAHSLPLSVIDRGDPYPQEVGASVHAVMKEGGFKNEFLLSYQSEVGPVRWLGPNTEQVIKDLGAKGRKKVLVVGIAFTSDHIETFSEIDIEYGRLATSVGLTEFRRAPAFNGEPVFQDALAQIVLDHLQAGDVSSSQYHLRCPGCTNPDCRNILNPAGSYRRHPYDRLRESAPGKDQSAYSRRCFLPLHKDASCYWIEETSSEAPVLSVEPWP